MALRQLKVVELAGLAPVPFCGMLLADYGAQVIRVDRPDTFKTVTMDKLCRGKKSICIDTKSHLGKQVLFDLITDSDILLDPYRPGVLEKIVDFEKLPAKTIVARLSGYGQNTAMNQVAGHDINYLAQSGVLDRLQTIPYNILADFAGGGLLAAFAIVSTVVRNNIQPPSQATFLDIGLMQGGNYIANSFPCLAPEFFPGEAGTSILDGGAPWYNIYETKDQKKIAVGAIEPKFYRSLLEGIDLLKYADVQMEQSRWSAMKRDFEKVFKSKTRNEWAEIFTTRDACVTPVLSTPEAKIQHKSMFLDCKNPVPRPVPTNLVDIDDTQPKSGQHTDEILKNLGYKSSEILNLKTSNSVF